MKYFCKIPSLVVSLGLCVPIVSVAVVPRTQAQSSAPGIGISGNRIIATHGRYSGSPFEVKDL